MRKPINARPGFVVAFFVAFGVDSLLRAAEGTSVAAAFLDGACAAIAVVCAVMTSALSKWSVE